MAQGTVDSVAVCGSRKTLLGGRLAHPRFPGRSVGLFGLLYVAPPASAHGEGETQEGYLLIQQAFGHLAHDTSHTGIELALEKVDDALATKDQDGVAVAEVEKARQALEAGHPVQARVLLQDSIKEALRMLPPARGTGPEPRWCPQRFPAGQP